MKQFSYLDLFAGAGGWSVGFEQAGFRHVAMYDHNESACRTARKNFGSIVHCVDLMAHGDIQFPEVDVVVGSPPCQGFSNEGYKKWNDPRNSLVWSFLEIVQRISPRAWVFENVPGFRRSYGGMYFELLKSRLQTWNYHWREFLLDSADFGVPQRRLRFVLIAARDFVPHAPQATHGQVVDLVSRLPHRTLWDAISDLPAPPLGDGIGRYQYSCESENEYQELMRKGSLGIFNHTTQRHSARVVDKIREVPVGGDMSPIVDSFAENRVHYCGGYRRAEKHKPSYTAYWTRGMTSIHPEQHRFLSPRECARIQSFPDTFVFEGATIENYTQVCNAVPPLLSQAIASGLRNQLVGTLSRHVPSSAETSVWSTVGK